ncbi:MAG: ferritin [Thermotogota bacterium]
MAMKEKLVNALNEQVNKELYSAYIYQSMAAYFDSKNLEGFSAWMDVQAQEEMEHARKIYDFIQDRGGRVKLTAIDEPKHEWESPLEVFTDALEHEEFVTDSINKLVDLAIEENDHAMNNFLQWFVAEQVEEEKTTGDIKDKLQLIGDNVQALLNFDEKLGGRQNATASESEE